MRLSIVDASTENASLIHQAQVLLSYEVIDKERRVVRLKIVGTSSSEGDDLVAVVGEQLQSLHIGPVGPALDAEILVDLEDSHVDFIDIGEPRSRPYLRADECMSDPLVMILVAPYLPHLGAMIAVALTWEKGFPPACPASPSMMRVRMQAECLGEGPVGRAWPLPATASIQG